MGLLDKVVGAASGLFGQHDEGQEGLPGAVMQLINDPQTGGLAGLMQSFDKAGLGETFSSWMSSGQNLPISAAQIEGVLGNEQVRNFAGKLGISPEQASAKLAEYLPRVIDKLTPDGKLPEGGDLAARGMELLKGKLFG
ncbi:MAG: YidB family protein [Rhodocyclaceae bacterium]